ncbi:MULTISPECIES: MarR family winged helix-turn-helix transcriptional regulator [unclassified Nonomuraea]|uniref:MarR family winged helix-turn-helix transcriptional regulator n=1 Tax=unclassified Nonomuraea TaxID=2593643 RepID=UPI00273AB0C8|nr:MarR family transcriptional regulator [Nonomuraea sp. G32]MDP4503466.1 MarR family transcriptional regulator [Nonomuraea sp. G32]
MVTTKEPLLRFTEALVRLSHLVQQVFDEVAREHDLTPQQAQLLCLLIDGPVGMTDLSRSLHLEKSSLTGLVDRAGKRGLVARARDSKDRRACRIVLTPEGERLGALAHEAMSERLEALAGKLPQEHRHLLTSAIGGILAEHTAQTGRAWTASAS